MTPEQNDELRRLRQCLGSYDDLVRLEELEKLHEKDGGVLARVVGAARSVKRWIAVRVLPVAAPRAYWQKPGIVVDPVVDDEFAESPIAQASRIHREYLDGLDSFKRQRQEWKDMFLESWPHHLAAQRLMERMLEDGRAQLVDLARIAERDLGARVTIAATQTPGAPPVGLAALYETQMHAIESLASHDVNVDEERERLLGEATSPLLDHLHRVNRQLFKLIQGVERDRDMWKEHALREQSKHNEHQARLQGSLAAASEIHGQLLAAVNAKRLADAEAPLRTRDDLRRAASESA